MAKLLTIRQEKGSKDKLQALLLIDELSSDEGFLQSLRQLLGEFERDRIEDALADAQVASMSISTDAETAGFQARGYTEMRAAIARGLEVLKGVVGTEDDS